jgi:hypothetical protein
MSAPLASNLDPILAGYGAEFPGYICLFVRQNKRSLFFANTERIQLEAAIHRAAPTCDLYIALGTQVAPLSGKRGSAATVVALPGFVADIDFAEAKGSAKNYPANEDEALRILRSFAFPPTMIVRTGNGLHAHFHLAAPFIINDDVGRDRAKQVWPDFQRLLSAHFRQHGRGIDSVGDLARNYRIPGTLNHKADPPKPVELVEYRPERRYPIGEIEGAIARGTERAPRKKGGQQPRTQILADHQSILRECEWYRETVVAGAASCDEPNWYAGASITALCTNGEEIFHRYSKQHPDYSQSEAAEKFRRTQTTPGPRTCESIAKDLGHAGCQACAHWGRIKSPIQLGSKGRIYDPGTEGPVPVGFTREGFYALLDPIRHIIVFASANQLLSLQYLLGLAPSAFWFFRYPPLERGRSFNFTAAGEALIAACKRAGPFVPYQVRGRGIWLEDDRIIVNLGGPAPTGTRYLYLCFEPIRLEQNQPFEAARLLRLLELFKWRNPHDAMLLLGWLAIAPICGVLGWRPHIFVYGPPKCGKTTIHILARQILHPLVISTGGSSSEAGIRQTLGPDSLPVAVDEFESDHAIPQLRSVVRLARSASSAENRYCAVHPRARRCNSACGPAFSSAPSIPSACRPPMRAASC